MKVNSGVLLEIDTISTERRVFWHNTQKQQQQLYIYAQLTKMVLQKSVPWT